MIRLVSLWVFTFALGGCSATHVDTDDGGVLDAAARGTDDGAIPDGAIPDGALPDGAIPDGALIIEDGGGCSCRTGSYHATGMGDGFSVDYYFDVSECGGTLSCMVGSSEDELTPRPCMRMPDGVFRVYIDSMGYVQLIFSSVSCTEAWTGQYATEGGSAMVTATRVP